MDKWRVWAAQRAQGNCRYRLFEVVRNTVVAALFWSLNFIFKERKHQSTWKLRHFQPERRVNKIYIISVVLLLSVLLNSHCTLHDDTHAHAATVSLRVSLWGLGNRTELGMHSKQRLTTLCHPLVIGLWKPQTTLALLHFLSAPSPQLLSGFVTSSGLHRIPARPCYSIATLSKTLGKGAASIVCWRIERDTESAEGIVAIMLTFCLKPEAAQCKGICIYVVRCRKRFLGFLIMVKIHRYTNLD